MKRANILFILLLFIPPLAFSQESTDDYAQLQNPSLPQNQIFSQENTDDYAVENSVQDEQDNHFDIDEQDEQDNYSDIDKQDEQNIYSEIDEQDDYSDIDEQVAKIVQQKESNIVKRITLPHRIFEIGYNIDFDVSNNYCTAKDFLKEHIVIDFTEIANKISKKGFSLNFNVTPEFFINLNLKNGSHFGFFTGIESYGEINIGKGLFDFLGKGKELYKDVKFDLGVGGDVFAYIGTAVGLNIQDYHIEVMPSLYMPIFHAETTNAKATLTNREDGYINARASATLEMYTFTELESLMNLDMDSILDNLQKGWGFDLYSSIEHLILPTLVGKIYSRFPIVPGKLNYAAKTNISSEFEIEELTSFISDFDSLKNELKTSDLEYETASYKIHRPFKMGTEIAWRPFGKWYVLDAMIGFGVKKPFTRSPHGFFEYNFSVSADLFIKNWDMLGIKFSTGYINEVFKHSCTLTFNLRVIELDVGVSSVAGSFLPSLKLAGAGAYVLVSFGW